MYLFISFIWYILRFVNESNWSNVVIIDFCSTLTPTTHLFVLQSICKYCHDSQNTHLPIPVIPIRAKVVERNLFI